MGNTVMPKSTRCQFDAGGWAPCTTLTNNGWCDEHENLKCCSCGTHAIRSCDSQMGGLGCGAALCATCEHAEDGHVTRAQGDQSRQKAAAQEAAQIASRSSLVQLMNEELGVPANLFELLKQDGRAQGYTLTTAYYLELKHGLMGFFPATVGDTKRIVITPDLLLIKDVWKTLPPRRSGVGQNNFYVSEALNIGYPLLGSTQSDNEMSRPQKLLTRAEFDKLIADDPKAFHWAPGLVSDDMGREEFIRSIEAVKVRVSA